MSAILSAEDLNDFISPGVACIKPVETLPKQKPSDTSNPYEVTTEEKVAASADVAPAQISLTDCLACSGCVTSAEAVLVSLQSHQEVLSTLDAHQSLSGGFDNETLGDDGMVFVASVSPQTRASIAATYGVTDREAGCMIEQLLCGKKGLKSGGRKGNGFTWVLDTNTLREVCQAAVTEEIMSTLSTPSSNATTNGHARDKPILPILASACPGWICYAEKTHPHVLPHLSRLKSPQALAGTLLKSVLSLRYGIAPDHIWHLAVMPCFDKKLEASREELMDTYWKPHAADKRGVRDVDCVITARELIMLADSRGISFPRLPQRPVQRPPFPDARIDEFLFPRGRSKQQQQVQVSGPSGGYAHHIIHARQAQIRGSTVRIERGRNADVVEYTLVGEDGQTIMKTARYFGFSNIQNLVRKLKPVTKSRIPGARLVRAENKRARIAPNGFGVSTSAAGTDCAYVEVMACPGGCTNGGGQIKVDDVASMRGIGEPGQKLGPAEQKEWLARVDEAYYSANSSSEEEAPETNETADIMDIDEGNDQIANGSVNGRLHGNQEFGLDRTGYIKGILDHWASCTGVGLDKLLFTTYRQVKSDVGKERGTSDVERVAGLASTLGGGW